MSYEEERRLSRELYNKYEFLRDIVSIYVEGVTWGGCQLVCEEKDGNNELITDIGADDLKVGVQNMLIDGHGDYKLNIFGKENVITITMLPEYPFAGEEGDRPLLWRVTRNAIPLDKIMRSIGKLSPEWRVFVRSTLDDILSGTGIPYAFFVEDPRTFSNTFAIKIILDGVKARVQKIRRSVEFGLSKYAKHNDLENLPEDASFYVEWNEDWCSDDYYGVAYQIFKKRGILLSTLREEEIATANLASQNYILPRETCEKIVKGFD